MQAKAKEIKKTSDSRFTMVHLPFPDETNDHGDIYGGHILRHIDQAGSICAIRHARMRVVTAAIEHMEFSRPAKPGQILNFHASVNIVAHSSMEVGVQVEAEDQLTGELTPVGTCYLTFVGLDEEGKPAVLPKIRPETEEDRRRMTDAARRMALARMERKLSVQRYHYLHFNVMPSSYVLCVPQKPYDVLFSFLATIPENSFLNMTHGEDGLSLLLETDYAEKASCMAEQSEPYAGIRLVGPLDRNIGGYLSTASAILEAEHIPVLSISSTGEEYLFIPDKKLGLAVDTLRSAGHFVER